MASLWSWGNWVRPYVHFLSRWQHHRYLSNNKVVYCILFWKNLKYFVSLLVTDTSNRLFLFLLITKTNLYGSTSVLSAN